MTRATPASWIVRCVGLALLLGVAGPHAVGAILDALLAIQFPFGIDYAEGVVWQQALQVPGPNAYSIGTALPFTVFNYPPLYYLLVHAVASHTLDLLVAGRTVSTLSTGVFAGLAGLIVFQAASVRTPLRLRWACAALTTLLVLCIPNIRAFGFLMRVDMLANALGLLALLIAFTGRPGLLRTSAALIVATLAVFTKQTEFAAGLTVAAVGLRFQPRSTLVAGLLVGGAGLTMVAVLQHITHGGFLRHLVIYNINRYDWEDWVGVIAGERDNLPLIGAVLVVAIIELSKARRAGLPRLATAVPVFLVLNLWTIAGLGKSGANYNYLNSLYGAGSMMVGIGLAHLLSGPRQEVVIGTSITVVLAVWIALLPVRRVQAFLDTQAPNAQAALVRMIAATSKAVVSDDLVLLLRAGREPLYEPAIITEVAIMGWWDEQPLIDLINQGGVAFAISERESLDDARRSPGVLAAMQAAFPRTRQITGRHWLHEP